MHFHEYFNCDWKHFRKNASGKYLSCLCYKSNVLRMWTKRNHKDVTQDTCTERQEIKSKGNLISQHK